MWPALDQPGCDLPVVDLPTRTGDVTMHLSCTLHMAQPPVERERRVIWRVLAPTARSKSRRRGPGPPAGRSRSSPGHGVAATRTCGLRTAPQRRPVASGGDEAAVGQASTISSVVARSLLQVHAVPSRTRAAHRRRRTRLPTPRALPRLLVAGAATAEGFDGRLRLPALKDVGAAGIDQVGGDGEVETAGCPAACSTTLTQPARWDCAAGLDGDVSCNDDPGALRFCRLRVRPSDCAAPKRSSARCRKSPARTDYSAIGLGGAPVGERALFDGVRREHRSAKPTTIRTTAMIAKTIESPMCSAMRGRFRYAESLPTGSGSRFRFRRARFLGTRSVARRCRKPRRISVVQPP
jgi:hypothetical protein